MSFRCSHTSLALAPASAGNALRLSGRLAMIYVHGNNLRSPGDRDRGTTRPAGWKLPSRSTGRFLRSTPIVRMPFSFSAFACKDQGKLDDAVACYRRASA